jgi:hypothetical protein
MGLLSKLDHQPSKYYIQKFDYIYNIYIYIYVYIHIQIGLRTDPMVCPRKPMNF